MNMSFKNKVALVTGAGSGLGLATAKALAESGASVVLADWHEEAAQSAAKELANKGHKTLAVRCDVSDDAQVEAMLIAFGAWANLIHAAVMAAQEYRNMIEHRDLAGVVLFAIVGVMLVALAPAEQPVERASTVAA